jgi:hypothetical protein
MLTVQLDDGEPLILTRLAGIRSGEIGKALEKWFNDLFAHEKSLPYHVVDVQKVPRPALQYRIKIAAQQQN